MPTAESQEAAYLLNGLLDKERCCVVYKTKRTEVTFCSFRLCKRGILPELLISRLNVSAKSIVIINAFLSFVKNIFAYF